MTNSCSAPHKTSTSDQWAAILRYNASQKDSPSMKDVAASSASAKTRRKSDQASLPATSREPKRLSLGDDLPHMPYLSTPTSTPPNPPRSSCESNTLCPSDNARLSIAYQTEDGFTQRSPTPPALKGDNAILIDRELDRLRRRHVETTRRHWRIYTGATMLIVLGICAFIFAKYVLAYLALSPFTWILFDAANGIKTSPDPLLRIMALVAVCTSGAALLGILSSGFYLRFSRHHSCGTLAFWIVAVTSTIMSILLCIVNLALIAIWHRTYASSSDGYASTRDVSRRCSGTWALDILWQAAESSSTAKLDTKSPPSCPHNATETLQHYLIAAGIRLAVIVAFCALWLICLAKYNRSLQIESIPIDGLEESAEMHRLLTEVDEAKQSGEIAAQEASNEFSYYKEELDRPDPGRQEENRSNKTTLVPPPRLDRFRWQRASSAVEDMPPNADQPEHHEKDSSAGAWSMGVVDQVWGALWGTNVIANHHELAQNDEDDYLIHDREVTKLGVRGWFHGSEVLSEDYGRAAGFDSRTEPVHPRTPSQEKRANEGRHAAARLAKMREEEGRLDASGCEERYRSDQQRRLEFLANLAGDERRGQPENGCLESRRLSQSTGDVLPHMPELTTHARGDSEEEDDGIYWQPVQDSKGGKGEHKTPLTHLYVRTMGKLIRTLSAIESEGSQERSDRRGRSGQSGSELY